MSTPSKSNTETWSARILMNSEMDFQSRDCKLQVAQVAIGSIISQMAKASWDRLRYHVLAHKVLHIATSSASVSITR